jgi:hypothetical protein
MKSLPYLSIALATVLLVSCTCVEDPGPLMEDTEEYALFDFDQLEIGDGFNIEVQQGETYEIRVRGDERNLKDLEVYKSGGTLVMKYEEYSGRKHQSYITITMPNLKSVYFSGGSVSSISGFNSEETLDFYLSGGSVAQLSVGYRAVNLTLSGGSVLRLNGLGDELRGNISGASELHAVDFPVAEASINLSGASNGKVKVADELTVTATGASVLYYSGNPVLHRDISGGSAVMEY